MNISVPQSGRALCHTSQYRAVDYLKIYYKKLKVIVVLLRITVFEDADNN